MLLQFHNTLDIKVPQYNTRVKLPAVAKDTMYDGMYSVLELDQVGSTRVL